MNHVLTYYNYNEVLSAKEVIVYISFGFSFSDEGQSLAVMLLCKCVLACFEVLSWQEPENITDVAIISPPQW